MKLKVLVIRMRGLLALLMQCLIWLSVSCECFRLRFLFHPKYNDSSVSATEQYGIRSASQSPRIS